MAFLQNQGARIYWDEQGSGDPILLIMGLGYPSYLWHRTRPALKEQYRTIALDNRGSGRSDAPAGTYSIAVRAEKRLHDLLMRIGLGPEEHPCPVRPYVDDC